MFQERDRLTMLLNDLRKQLEEETLLRVDAENALQTLKEDFAFKEQVNYSIWTILVYFGFTCVKKLDFNIIYIVSHNTLNSLPKLVL